MKQDTIEKIYQTRDGSLLYRADYRLHADGHWRRTIDSRCTLTSDEQRINNAGGVDYGKDTAVILGAEIKEAREIISEYTDEEIQSNPSLRFFSDWLKDAIGSV